MGIVSIDNLNGIKSRNESLNFNRNRDSLESQGTEFHHETFLFPESVTDYVTLVSGTNDTWNNWTQIVSHNGSQFFDKIKGHETHISRLMIEDVSVKDKRFAIELSYGSSNTVISRHRFLSGETKFLDAIQSIRVRSDDIPANSTIYYRLACEQDNATCDLSIGWHIH